MPAKTITGSCQCGAVKMKITADPMMTVNCHCLDCQHSSGAGHVTHSAIPEQGVEVTGNLASYEYRADSGNAATKYFCPVCGSNLYGKTSGMPGALIVRVGALDDSSDFRPQVTVFEKRLRPWDMKAEGIPAFEAMPPMPAAAQ